MRIAKGPRPWTIHLFAIGFAALGTVDLLSTLSNLEVTRENLQFDLPSIIWTQDMVIVLYSALFSIVLIPVAAVWLFASKIARILVTVMSVFPLLNVVAAVYILSRDGFLSAILVWDSIATLCLVALLYFRPSGEWFEGRKALDAATFE